MEFLPSSWRRAWLPGFCLVVVTLMAYQPVWHAGFIWDDDAHLTPPELRSLHGLDRIWTELGATQQYYPLVYSVFWVEHKLWGDAPLGYHLINVLLHAFSALLLAKLLRQLQIPGAWLTAALFALYPLEVESVAWVSELKNTLSGVFYLGAALVYLEFDRKRSGKNYALAMGLFLLGLMSKTVIASLPAALLVIFWWQRGRLTWKGDARPLIPFFLTGIGAGLVTSWVERKLLHAEGAEYDFSIIARILIAGRDIWFYLGKIIWPADLAFFYPKWKVSPAVWWQYLFPAAVLLLLGLLIWRRWRGALAALLFFVGTLFPALGFFNVYPFHYSFVADHFQYLAILGPLTLAAAGLSALPGLLRKSTTLLSRNNSVEGAHSSSPQRSPPRRGRNASSVETKSPTTFLFQRGRRQFPLPGGEGEPYQLTESFRLSTALGATLLLVLGILTWKQCRAYANEDTLWQQTYRLNPDCWMAHNYFGFKQLQQGQFDEAKAQFQKALAIYPGCTDALDNLGLALLQQGRADEAILQFQKVLEIRPDNADACNNLGTALLQKGKLDEAITYYRRALRTQPYFVDLHCNLGMALLAQGKVDEALLQYEEALQINPESGNTHKNLGLALLKKRRTLEAMAHFQKAVETIPGDAEAHFNLGNSLRQTGHMNDALAHFRRSLEINPGYVDAHVNLGNILLQMGMVDEAVAHFQKALQLKPDDSDAQNDLGNAFLRKGNPGEAIAHYQEALRIQPTDLTAENNLAWLLATCPDASLRNGSKAVELARKADEQAGGKKSGCSPHARRILGRGGAVCRSGGNRAARPSVGRSAAQRGAGQGASIRVETLSSRKSVSQRCKK